MSRNGGSGSDNWVRINQTEYHAIPALDTSVPAVYCAASPGTPPRLEFRHLQQDTSYWSSEAESSNSAVNQDNGLPPMEINNTASGHATSGSSTEEQKPRKQGSHLMAVELRGRKYLHHS
jgi:hypothetical protein